MHHIVNCGWRVTITNDGDDDDGDDYYEYDAVGLNEYATAGADADAACCRLAG